MFYRIPNEMRTYRQWICWRSVERNGAKATKVPINPRTGNLASVTVPGDWGTFIEACEASQNHSGIGFIFTKNDPFFGIDLDHTFDDKEAFERQKKIVEAFSSYTEFSPSGLGLHIIAKGTLPGNGRRRSAIEMYDDGRYFTMTGNIFRDLPISNCQDVGNILYDQLGGAVQKFEIEDREQKHSDEEIIAQAENAANGDKFKLLYAGEWRNFGYPSQSEADFALTDIIAFYTQNRAQIARLYRASALGQTSKDGWLHRGDRHQYVGYMVEKSFDRQLPKVDIEGLCVKQIKIIEALERKEGGESLESEAILPPPDLQGTVGSTEQIKTPVSCSREISSFPDGLVGQIAQYIYDAAPRPVKEIALAGAIGLVAGLTGRYWNISNGGLNQYVLLIAETGRGKEAIAHGIGTLVKAVRNSVPTIENFVGPSEIASPQALIKVLAGKPCIYSIVGEFGLKLKEMSSERAPPHITGLKRALLDLYHKSGQGAQLGAMAYSKKEDNIAAIMSPSFTLIGESTPEKFFENVNEDIVTDGLLPRFTIFEYQGEQVELNKNRIHKPPLALVSRMSELVAHANGLQGQQAEPIQVQMTIEAEQIFVNFECYARAMINNRDPVTGLKKGVRPNSVVTELWNRTHLKALRLAAVLAVGCSFANPKITGSQAQWATDEIFWQTRALQGRFDNGEIGGGAVNAIANEAKQSEVMIRLIGKFIAKDWKTKSDAYRISEDMRRDRVFPFSALISRLQIYAVFKNDRRGATEAIRRAYQLLLDNDDLQEIPRKQMSEKYGRSCRAFCISNAERFLEIS